MRTVFPTVREQRGGNHRLVNVLDTLPKKVQAEARELLTTIPYAATQAGRSDSSAASSPGDEEGHGRRGAPAR